MADVKITQFDDAGTLSGTEKLYVVRGATDYNTTPDAIKARVKGDIVNDLTTGGATKFASAETVKTLDGAKVDKVAGKSLILDTEITRLASVTNQTLSGLGGEAVSNKKQTLTNSETDYPSGRAVSDKIAQLAGEVEQLAYVKIKNEAVNGNFENGLIAPFSKLDGGGGESTLAINSSTPISGNYDIRFTITTPSTNFNRPYLEWLNRAGNIGDKIYIHFYAKILSGTPMINSIYDGASNNSIYAGDVINGSNTRIINVVGIDIYLGRIYFRSSAVWDMQMDNFIRINLTETFGAGNEPTEEEMNLLISTLGVDYFEGEITIPAQKIMQWQLALIRKNKNAIIALDGTII